MNLIRVKTVFMKQIKDTLKNKSILLQFMMLPLMSIIMSNLVHDSTISFIKMFGAMYIGMAPLVITASIISEEKETNTLRMLLFSNVKAGEYLLGIGSYVWIFCSLGSLLMACSAGYAIMEIIFFVCISMIGIIISTMIGACVGIACENQMSATSYAIPIMLVFAFLPMLSMFNETIKTIGKFAYTQQINVMFENLTFSSFTLESGIILGLSFLLTAIVFRMMYQRKHTLL